jgi:hypothetical protein
MVIAASLLVRDEADIVLRNIEHHVAAGVSYFVVTDNGSRDETLQLVSSHPAVRRLIIEPSLNYRQSEWVSRMAAVIAAEGADWIVHLDADEFWYGLDHLADVPADKLVVKAGDAIEPHECSGQGFRDFVCVPELVGAEFDPANFPYYRDGGQKPMRGCKIAHRPVPGIVVTQGNHDANVPRSRHTCDPRVRIDHYSVRSYDHFERKVVNGGSAYLKSGLPHHIGHHWREWYQLWLAGCLRDEFDRMSYTKQAADTAVGRGELHVRTDTKSVGR